MKFEGLRIRNLGPFGDAELNLEEVDGRVVAVAGANGAGKSTLLELFAAGLFRSTPTRGKLAELATGRDSFVEVRAVNGSSYTLRHMVDAVSGKGESLVLDASGSPVLSSGKVREFDSWAASHLPAQEVFFSSVFAAQGSGGFLDMKPGDRKAVLLRTLGIEHLERVAEKAREHERALKHRLDVVTARLNDEKARGLDVAEAEQALAEAKTKAAGVESLLEKAKAELAQAEQDARAVQKAQEASQAHAAAKTELEGRRSNILQRIADLERRIANNRRVLDDARTIRSAVEDVEYLRAKLEALRAKHGDTAKDAQSFDKEAVSWWGRSKDAEQRAASASARIESAKRRLAGRESVERAVAELESLRDAVGKAAQEHLEASEAYDSLSDKTVVGLDERIVGLRSGLSKIAYEPVGDVSIAQHISRSTIESDDDAAKLAAELPTLKSEGYRRMDAARRVLDSARARLDSAERIAARAPDLDLAQQDLASAQSEHDAAKSEAEAHGRRSSEARAKSDEAAKKAFSLRESINASEARLAEVEPVAARAKHLDTAEARIDELAPQLDDARRELASINADVARLGEAPIVPPHPDVEGAQFRVRMNERMSRDANAAPPVREHALQQARESAARVAELESERSSVEAELADYAKLATDLGRNGLQAFEVDAVGVELTALVNELLLECVGPRWTVSIETQRNSADGKKTIEGCDVRVIDTERGRDASAESLSGGEKVLVSEAISLALSMLACRRAGIEGVTLVRDETGAALDPSNARGYVAMLRKAADIIGASKVLFVSHSQDVQELADARVLVVDGKVEVQA